MKINLIKILFVVSIVVNIYCLFRMQNINNIDIINNSELAKNIGKEIIESHFGEIGEFRAMNTDKTWLVVEEHKPKFDDAGYVIEINSKDGKIIKSKDFYSSFYNENYKFDDIIDNSKLAEKIFKLVIKSHYGYDWKCEVVDNGKVWEIDDSRHHMTINKKDGIISLTKVKVENGNEE